MSSRCSNHHPAELARAAPWQSSTRPNLIFRPLTLGGPLRGVTVGALIEAERDPSTPRHAAPRDRSVPGAPVPPGTATALHLWPRSRLSRPCVLMRAACSLSVVLGFFLQSVEVVGF